VRSTHSSQVARELPDDPPDGGPGEGLGALDFRAVFEGQAPFVWRLLRRLGVAERDIPDLCQDVFVIVHRTLPKFDGGCAVRTWLYGIGVRVAADYRRRACTRLEHITAEAPQLAAPAMQHEALELREAQAILQRALRALDDDKRAVFVLYEMEDLRMPEIAEIVGCPVQTAYARLYAARKQVLASFRRVHEARRIA
jgi:RNA polymerase sigma-70 factor (ECF subfamily)